MTKEEKSLIRSLAFNKITKSEFLSSYPVDIKNEINYILSLLNDAYQGRNSEQMEYGLMLLPLDDFTSKHKYVKVLNELMVADWHQRHEDIASLLKGIHAPESVDVLYEAALIQHDYLEYDDTYQLARKCIKALSAIAGEASINKLTKLSHNPIPEIASYAKKELNSLGE